MEAFCNGIKHGRFALANDHQHIASKSCLETTIALKVGTLRCFGAIHPVESSIIMMIGSFVF